MLKITIEAEGHTWTALKFALVVAMEDIRKECLAGLNSNEDSSYDFKVTGEESCIRIYEDNAGQIFLHLEGTLTIYQDDPFITGEAYEKDTEAIFSGDTFNWSPDWVHRFPNQESLEEWIAQPEMRLILSCYPDGSVQYGEQPGKAGERFLGIDGEVSDA